MALTIHQIPVGGFDKNFSYIIGETATKEAFIVDPSGDFLEVSAQIAAFGYIVQGILLTHTHQDHFDKLAVALVDHVVPIYVHTHGITEVQTFGEVRALEDGMLLPLGENKISVLHTPGHIDDAVCFFFEATEAEDGIPKVITGDTLFVGGCGRTNELRVKDLYESLAELANLPDETVVFPGHDYGPTPTSTIGHEKQTNRFYQAQNFNDFKKERLG